MKLSKLKLDRIGIRAAKKLGAWKVLTALATSMTSSSQFLSSALDALWLVKELGMGKRRFAHCSIA